MSLQLYANKIAECSATYYMYSKSFKLIGEDKKAVTLNKMSKAMADILIKNYGRERATKLLVKEINELKKHSSNKTKMMNLLEKKFNECYDLLNSK